jgi:peptidoglycan/LPS O-acetylase OafA/YrhL
LYFEERAQSVTAPGLDETEQASLNKQSTYWPELDGLRSVAFLLVFFSHCPPSAIGPISNIASIYCSWGWVGVDLFFVLSGYLITYLLVKEKFSFGSISIPNFYKRRALRIWPLYFLVLTGAALFPLFMHHWNAQYRMFMQQVILPFFLFTGNYAMIHQFSALIRFCDSWGIASQLYVGLLLPLWSLCIEEQFYLFWPGLLNFVKTKGGIYFAIGLLFMSSVIVRFVLVAIALAFRIGHVYYYMDSFSHLDALMVGAFLALTEYKSPGWFAKYTQGSKGWLIVGILSFIFCIIPLTVPSIYNSEMSIVPAMTVLALAFGTLLVLTQTWNPLKTLFKSNILVSIGRVSFAMYLFHLSIIRLVQMQLPNITGNQHLNWLIQAFLSLGLTYLAAKISWVLLESRFLKARVKFTRVQSETAVLLEDNLSSVGEKMTSPSVLVSSR